MGNTAAVMTMVCVYAGGFQGGAGVGRQTSPGKRSVAASFPEASACTQVRKLPKGCFLHLLNLTFSV